MDFDVPVINKNVKIMKAEPFDFLSDNDKGQSCLSVFKGNRYTMIDEKNNCTNDITHPATEDRAVVLLPSRDHQCNLHANRTLKWKLIDCGEDVNSDRLIQYKLNRDELHIYCFPHKLQLDNKPPFACPNAVICLDKHQQFSVDGRRYITNAQTFNTQTHFGFSVSDLINNRSFVLPGSHQPALTRYRSLL